jgi:RNA-binding protein
MLTGKQRRFLRAQAHHLGPILQVGKAGVTENLVEQIRLALEAHELIKISILPNCEQDRHEVAEQLSGSSGAELVQVLGRTVVLYRPSSTKKQIVFP